MFRGKEEPGNSTVEKTCDSREKQIRNELKCDGTWDRYSDVRGSIPFRSRRELWLFTGQRHNHYWNDK